MEPLGKRFHVIFLGHTYWFIFISISQIKYHSISVDQAGYATYVVVKYINTVIIKENSKFHETTLPHYMIFTKEDASTSDEQVGVLFREYNIHYRACVVSLIYILSTRVDLFLQYTSWQSFHQILVKYTLKVWYTC